MLVFLVLDYDKFMSNDFVDEVYQGSSYVLYKINILVVGDKDVNILVFKLEFK